LASSRRPSAWSEAPSVIQALELLGSSCVPFSASSRASAFLPRSSWKKAKSMMASGREGSSAIASRKSASAAAPRFFRAWPRRRAYSALTSTAGLGGSGSTLAGSGLGGSTFAAGSGALGVSAAAGADSAGSSCVASTSATFVSSDGEKTLK
jgi:hypothetical protein